MITEDDAKIQNYDKKEEYFSRNQEYFSRNLKVFFEKSKVIFYIPTYYKPITFSSFTLNTIKFCPRTIAIPDIFPNFASTFLTNEMNMNKQL